MNCANCGAPLEADSLFCMNCGMEVVPEPGGFSPDPGAFAGGSIICPACSQPNEADSAFCIVCGSPLSAPPTKPEPGSGLSCPGCGSPLEPDSQFCMNCGRDCTDILHGGEDIKISKPPIEEPPVSVPPMDGLISYVDPPVSNPHEGSGVDIKIHSGKGFNRPTSEESEAAKRNFVPLGDL